MVKTEKALEICPSVFAEDHTKLIPTLKLTRTHRIILIGTGSSHHVALWAHWFIKSFYGFEVQVFQTWDFLAASEHVHDEDLVIVFSQRGSSSMTQILLKNLNGHPNLVLIAAKGGKKTSVNTIEGTDLEDSHAHTKSLFAAMGVIIDFFNVTFSDKKLQKSILHQKRETTKVLAVLGAILPKGRHYKIQSSYKHKRFHIVGGGPFDAIAAEMALKIKEMAHVHADHYGLEEILHGPLISFKKEDAILLLSPRSVSKNKLNQYLYHERLTQLVKKLEMTSAGLMYPVFDDEVDASLQGLHPVFQSVVMLYWGQWFSFKLAETLKVNPDHNPYL